MKCTADGSRFHCYGLGMVDIITVYIVTADRVFEKIYSPSDVCEIDINFRLVELRSVNGKMVLVVWC